jgi:long-chain acyl-CoA synthetase
MQSAKDSGTYSSSIYDSLIFQKVKDSFGGRIRLLGSGSAPISAETHMFMKAIMCSPLIEGYGST